MLRLEEEIRKVRRPRAQEPVPALAVATNPSATRIDAIAASWRRNAAVGTRASWSSATTAPALVPINTRGRGLVDEAPGSTVPAIATDPGSNARVTNVEPPRDDRERRRVFSFFPPRGRASSSPPSSSSSSPSPSSDASSIAPLGSRSTPSRSTPTPRSLPPLSLYTRTLPPPHANTRSSSNGENRAHATG